MRASRRRSRGKREPLFWSRACALASGGLNGPQDAVDCDESLVKFGVVLFDAVAAQMNSAESRITLRKLHWTSDVICRNTTIGAPPDGSLWCVVVKTSLDVTALIGNNTTLADLLGGGALAAFDVLDVKIFPFRSGSAANIVGGNTVSGMTGGQKWDFELNVQRKLEVEDKVVALFGFVPGAGAALTANQFYATEVFTIISALWQRTLR